MATYEIISEGRGPGPEPGYQNLLGAYKGLSGAKDKDDIRKVVLALGTSVGEGKISRWSASLFVLFAQRKFLSLPDRLEG